MLAHLLEEAGTSGRSTAEIETAVRLGPESWEVNREAARLIFRQGRIADSIPYFEKASALMESDWHNPSMLVTCYRGLGDAEQLLRVARMTVERAEKAIAKDPSNSAILAVGAPALAIVGEDQRGKEWIDRALLLDPDNIILRYNLACALASDLHDEDRAIEVLEPYLRTTLEHDTYPACRGRSRPRFPEKRRALQDNAGPGQGTPGHIGGAAAAGTAAA